MKMRCQGKVWFMNAEKCIAMYPSPCLVLLWSQQKFVFSIFWLNEGYKMIKFGWALCTMLPAVITKNWTLLPTILAHAILVNNVNTGDKVFWVLYTSINLFLSSQVSSCHHVATMLIDNVLQQHAAIFGNNGQGQCAKMMVSNNVFCCCLLVRIAILVAHF